MNGQCDARPTVTFPVAGHRCPATGTNLYYLVTEVHVCEQLAQGRYLGRELNSRPLALQANPLAMTPPGHTVMYNAATRRTQCALELATRNTVVERVRAHRAISDELPVGSFALRRAPARQSVRAAVTDGLAEINVVVNVPTTAAAVVARCRVESSREAAALRD